MKLTLGYIAAFLTMTMLIGGMFAAGIGTLVAMFSFIHWSIPTGVTIEIVMFMLRVCLAIGSVIGFFFVFSKEGRGFAEDFAQRFSGEKE